MTTDFKCPHCAKFTKVGRLRAKYQCPNCNTNLLITREEKLVGHKIYRKVKGRKFVKTR